METNDNGRREQVYWFFTCAAICVLPSFWHTTVLPHISPVFIYLSLWAHPPAGLPFSSVITFSSQDVAKISPGDGIVKCVLVWGQTPPPYLQLMCSPCLSICSYRSHSIHVCQVWPSARPSVPQSSFRASPDTEAQRNSGIAAPVFPPHGQ